MVRLGVLGEPLQFQAILGEVGKHAQAVMIICPLIYGCSVRDRALKFLIVALEGVPLPPLVVEVKIACGIEIF